MSQCTAQRHGGAPCRNSSMHGEPFCHYHSPDRIRPDGKSTVAAAGGELARANDRALRRSLVGRLDSIEAIQATLERAAQMVLNHASDHDIRCATLLVQAARAAAGTLKGAADEKEIDQMRAEVLTLVGPRRFGNGAGDE